MKHHYNDYTKSFGAWSERFLPAVSYLKYMHVYANYFIAHIVCVVLSCEQFTSCIHQCSSIVGEPDVLITDIVPAWRKLTCPIKDASFRHFFYLVFRLPLNN